MPYEEISIIVNFFVAVGTIILAFFAYQNIKSTEKQLKSFQKQTTLFLTQNLPILKFDNFCFRENSLIIFLNNFGTRPAYDIGCLSICLQAKKVAEKKDFEWMYNFQWPNISKADINDYFNIENNQNIVVSDDILFSEKKIKTHVRPEHTITFLKRENGDAFLGPNEIDIRFKCEPVFCLSNLNERQKDLFLKGNPDALRDYQYRKFSFSEIKTIFKENKIRFVYLSFELYCKDPLDNAMFQNDIISCIIDLDEDDTIEKAIPKQRKLVFYSLSFTKFVREIGWQPHWMYKHGKWRSTMFEDEDEQKDPQKRALIRHKR